MKTNSIILPPKSKFTVSLLALWIVLAAAPSCSASRANAQTDGAAPTAPAAIAPAAEPEPQTSAAEQAAADKPAAAERPAVTERKAKRTRSILHTSRKSGNEKVAFGQDSKLDAGESADAVVSIFGSSTSDGEISDAVVSIFGSSTSSNNVNDAVVSVIGNTRVTGGTVGDSAVAVLGSTYVNAHIKRDVVAVMGNVELGPDAVVDGQVVCIGGELKRDPKAVVHGDVQNVTIGGPFDFEGLQTWIRECLLYARPLAFNAGVMWAWYIAFALLGFYALLALATSTGVNKCVQTLVERPGYSILASVLVVVLTPVVTLLLLCSMAIVVGFALLPIFSLGLFFAAVFGKVVMLAWIGRLVAKILGNNSPMHPFFAVLVGGLIVMGIYTVPILGFVTFKLLDVLGLGVVVYTLMLMFKNHRAATVIVPAPGFVAGAAADAPAPMGGAAFSSAALGGAALGSAALGEAASPTAISAGAMELAGFWRRMLACLLDLFMVAIVVSLIADMLHWRNEGGALILWITIYNMVMWGTRSTTVGGVICGLKLVRLDGRKVDGGIAVVRGLSAFLSLAVAGLGFIWVAFDDHKQSWHDKIAGTTIVKVPKGTALL